LTGKGYEFNSDGEILAARRQIELDEVLDFLASFDEVARVMIVVDNLDECSKETIDLTRSFVRNLVVRGTASPRAQKIAVLLPLRNYSINRFGDTKRYAMDDLPEPDYIKIFVKKIELLEKLIMADARSYTGEVSAAAFSRVSREHTLSSVTYKIAPASIKQFLERLARYLLTAHSERDFAPFLKSVSAGNCKYLVAGLYNFLHSCKLPLSPLFTQAFLPDYTVDKGRQIVQLGTAIECLMAIHYPFYDVDASSICNVFNAADFRAPNSYQNTLVIPRLMARLVNAEQPLTFGRLRQDFRSIGYQQRAVEAAFRKLCKYGLIASSEGYQLDDWVDETELSSTTATKTYLHVVVIELGYLMYISEDVPMPAEFVVSIVDKYGGTLIGGGSRSPRLNSISRFLDFVEAEERIERNAVIDKKRLSEHSFLERFGVNVGSKHVPISQFMREGVAERLAKAGA
jgi:hypothetical protein